MTRAQASCSTLEALASAASAKAIAQATCDMAADLPGISGVAFVDWPATRCLATSSERASGQLDYARTVSWTGKLWSCSQPAGPAIDPQSGVIAVPVGRQAPIAALAVFLDETQPAHSFLPALCEAADLAYVALRGLQRAAAGTTNVNHCPTVLAPAQRDQFRRTERLASIGVLAAGIAHELNNPLGAIMLEAETALMMAKRSEPQPLLLSSLDGIRQNVERCAQIVQAVLRFAKRQPEEHGPCDLVSVLQSARDYSRELAVRSSVRVRFDAFPRAAKVVGSRLALEQVFVNLFHNAIQASLADGVVEVRIEFGPEEIAISVADQGAGISAADLPRLFEPFFTTRAQMAGTGLGLSIVQGIVDDHHGRVEVKSQVGQGAIFTVVLPRTLEP